MAAAARRSSIDSRRALCCLRVSSSPATGRTDSILASASRSLSASCRLDSRLASSSCSFAARSRCASKSSRYWDKTLASASPPNRSRASRWADSERNRIWSDWPCTTTRCSASSWRTDTGAPRPPTTAFERPSAEICRARTSSPSSTEPPTSSTRGAIPGAWSTRKCPSTQVAGAPCRTRAVSARCPRRSPSAVTTMVFPAPVSPVRAINPGPSGSDAREITPKSWMSICSITSSPGPGLSSR